MGCNCGGGTTGTATRYQLIKADGSSGGVYLSRTEALAAMTLEAGAKVVTVS